MENCQASQNEKIVVTAGVVVEKLVVEEVVVTAVVVMAVKNVLQVTAILVNGPIAPIMSPNNNAVIIMDTKSDKSAYLTCKVDSNPYSKVGEMSEMESS